MLQWEAMKKLLFAVVLVAAGLAGYFSYSSPPVIVAFGDSLTQGVGSSGGGFVKILSDDIGLPIVNLGVAGDTTADALKRIMEAASLEPDVTIVLLGGNDFLQNVPEEKTFENLGEITERMLASGSEVLLLGLSDDFGALPEKYGVAYVPDILGGIWGREEMMSDALHPNDRGYELMAERVRPVLEQLLD